MKASGVKGPLGEPVRRDHRRGQEAARVWLALVLAAPCLWADSGLPLPGSIASAMATIQSAHSSHPTDLHLALESDSALRAEYVGAHLELASSAASVDGPQIAAFYRDLVGDASSVAGHVYFERARVYDPVASPTMAFIRERALHTYLDAGPATPGHLAEVADRAGFSGRRRDILVGFGILVMDNSRLSGDQVEIIHELLSLLPAGKHDTRVIGAVDLLGAFPAEIEWWDFFGGRGGAINIFSAAPGLNYSNQFPADVSPGRADLFAIALAHELSHIVDAFAARPGQIPPRGLELVGRAGCEPLNYLRSTLPDCFFANAPVEFFASIGNEWFADSAKVLELALVRWQAGFREPLNQFLYFADRMSLGPETFFYLNDQHGRFRRTAIPVDRDSQGRVQAVVVSGLEYQFALDLAGNVTGYTTRVAPCSRDAETACLLGGRFEVKVAWRTSEQAGRAQVMSFSGARTESDQSAFYSFFDPANFEMGVKVLDGCALNAKFWVFVSGLTNQEFSVSVRDTQSNLTRLYSNPLGRYPTTVGDTSALDCP